MKGGRRESRCRLPGRTWDGRLASIAVQGPARQAGPTNNCDAPARKRFQEPLIICRAAPGMANRRQSQCKVPPGRRDLPRGEKVSGTKSVCEARDDAEMVLVAPVMGNFA